jgi:hypothetical protein
VIIASHTLNSIEEYQKQYNGSGFYSCIQSHRS